MEGVGASCSWSVLVRKSDAFLWFPVQMTPRSVNRVACCSFFPLWFFFQTESREQKKNNLFVVLRWNEHADWIQKELREKKSAEEIGNWQKWLKMLRLQNGEQRQMELIINVFINKKKWFDCSARIIHPSRIWDTNTVKRILHFLVNNSEPLFYSLFFFFVPFLLLLLLLLFFSALVFWPLC